MSSEGRARRADHPIGHQSRLARPGTRRAGRRAGGEAGDPRAPDRPRRPADGRIVPVRIADNPAGAKLRELLTAALDQAPPDYDGILPVLTRLAPAAVIRAARDCSTG